MSGEGASVVADEDQARLFQEAVAGAQQQTTFKLKNERGGEPDVELKYYLDERGRALAYEIFSEGGEKQSWQAFPAPWPFPWDRFNRDWVVRHFAMEVILTTDSLLLVLPYFGPSDPIRLPAWHIWAGGSDWYFFTDSGYLKNRDGILLEKTESGKESETP